MVVQQTLLFFPRCCCSNSRHGFGKGPSPSEGGNWQLLHGRPVSSLPVCRSGARETEDGPSSTALAGPPSSWVLAVPGGLANLSGTVQNARVHCIERPEDGTISFAFSFHLSASFPLFFWGQDPAPKPLSFSFVFTLPEALQGMEATRLRDVSCFPRRLRAPPCPRLGWSLLSPCPSHPWERQGRTASLGESATCLKAHGMFLQS